MGRTMLTHPPHEGDIEVMNCLRPVYKPHSVQRRSAWTAISLGSLPGTDHEASSLSSLLDLAPDGGYQAARIAADAGGLLHHLFTLTFTPGPLPKGKGARVMAVCFLWPYPAGFPAPRFPRHRALRSADFPRFLAKPRPSNRPEAVFIIPAQPRRVNIPLTLCQRAAKMIRIVCYYSLAMVFSHQGARRER